LTKAASLADLQTPPAAPIPPLMPDLYQAETLLIDGPDAVAFAQSQFSGNVSELAVGRWQFNAWLDAQGRVRALFHLARLDEQRLLLMLRGGRAAPLADALRRFVFRSKLTLQALPSRMLARAAALELHAIHIDGDSVVLGCGTHGLAISAHEDDAWRAEQIHLGWPWLPDSATDALLPPALSLERLNAVAFDKGCFPGQEIAARLHYRGGHKRHMHCVVLSRAVVPGSVLSDGVQDVAIVLDNVPRDGRNIGLAIITDTLAEHGKQHTLQCDGQNIDIELSERWPA
jgi:hypothetical protein